jgi:hypothetical protein
MVSVGNDNLDFAEDQNIVPTVFEPKYGHLVGGMLKRELQS